MDNNEFRESVKENISVIRDRARDKEIWIYGAGMAGSIVLDVLSNAGVAVKGFIDKNKSEILHKFGLPVQTIDEIDKNNIFIIIAVLDYYMATQLLDIAVKKIGDERKIFCLNYEKINNDSDLEYKGIVIGRYTHDYKNFLSMANSIEVESIGRFCSINPTARFCPNHLYGNVSTYSMWRTPFRNVDEATKIYTNWNKSPKARIGNDVWIGANVVILPGVQIGDGAVIGANAVVAKDVKPYEIVGGVPARHIRYRFSQKVIETMLRIQWWNWDDKTIQEREADFYDIEKFVLSYDV